jgi:hypothetical protein
MNRHISVLFCGLLAVPCACAQEEPPTVDGYITRAASGSDFDVNGIHILCGEKTQILLRVAPGESNTGQGCPQRPPYVGEPMRVYGSRNKKEHALEATRIEPQPEPAGEVSGVAVIDAPPSHDPSVTKATGLLVRADGYRIRLDAKTQIAWAASLHALSDVKSGDWIEYKGRMGSDGVLVAACVKLTPDLVSSGEEKLRAKNDFDPSTVPASAKQSATSVAFIGVNPKRFPPYDDAAMQARVAAIGEKLIPDYQRNLPDSDPDKIQFRFQVIDTKWFRDALTLPSGVILVPRQVVERMQSDSQLATVLADNIACALEKQTYRALPASRAVSTGYYATQVAGLFVPGLGLAGIGAGIGGMEAIRIKAEEQSGRVSLGLLQDAGYDIDQAPVAWWLLASKKPEPVSDISTPERAAYLYRMLGETWHNPGALEAP